MLVICKKKTEAKDNFAVRELSVVMEFNSNRKLDKNCFCLYSIECHSLNID